MSWQPDYKRMLDVVFNRKPAVLPIYEHLISIEIMETILGRKFAQLYEGTDSDLKEFYRNYCEFFRVMTYDTVSFEYCIAGVMPGPIGLYGQHPGPIQTRKDYDSYPWQQLPDMYWVKAKRHFDAVISQLPIGMKIVGGVGNGIFELSESLVGLEYLAYLQADDLSLYADVYARIGDTLVSVWQRFLKEYSDYVAICRFGDDLGFKSGTLTSVNNIRNYILPQYKRVISMIRTNDKPFLWHSCGCIFDVMDDVIALGINAKHSNEDAIAPFDIWIQKYSKQIGLVGGIDLDLLCQNSPDEIQSKVVEMGSRFRRTANGYALGSGNSITDYVPVDNYMAMIDAVRQIRELPC